jgi:hypothetical protein
VSASSLLAPTQTQRPVSLREVLQSLLDDLPGVLLDTSGRRDLLGAAAPLPHVLSRRSLGLELRLQGAPGGDMFAAVVPTAPDGRVLLEVLRGGGLGADPATRRLADALSQWRTGTGWLADSCAFLLLEIDATRRTGDAFPPPCVYLAPRGANDADPGADCSANAFHRDPAGLVAALAELSACSADPAATRELARMLELLPDGAELFAAGAMLSRASSRAPRIAVRRIYPDKLEGLLAGLGRDRAARTLAPLADVLAPHLTNLCIALDLGPHSSDAVGLELYAGSYWSEGKQSGWTELLSALVDRGLADAERAAAAASLPRRGDAAHPTVGLSHVKLTAKADGLAPSKLYIGYEGAHRLAFDRGTSP